MPWYLSNQLSDFWDMHFICDFYWYFMMTCRGGKFRRHVWAARRLSLNLILFLVISRQNSDFFFIFAENAAFWRPLVFPIVAAVVTKRFQRGFIVFHNNFMNLSFQTANIYHFIDRQIYKMKEYLSFEGSSVLLWVSKTWMLPWIDFRICLSLFPDFSMWVCTPINCTDG